MNDGPIPLSYQSSAEAPLVGWSIVRWWEYRRLLYNGAMLITGLLTVASMWGASSLDQHFPPGSPFSVGLSIATYGFGIVAYGFCANICYTAGWILDLAWKEPDPDAASRRRRGIFVAGLIFSCVVTTVPLWLTIGMIVLRHL